MELVFFHGDDSLPSDPQADAYSTTRFYSGPGETWQSKLFDRPIAAIHYQSASGRASSRNRLSSRRTRVRTAVSSARHASRIPST